MTPSDSAPIWIGSREVQATSNITSFMSWLQETDRVTVGDYQGLWSWSVDHIEEFWQAIWDYFEVQATGAPEGVLTDSTMPGAIWFPGTKLSYAEHVFRMANDQRAALVAVDETGASEEWSWGRLRRETGAFAGYLRDVGVKKGDRVVGFIPNIPEAIVAFLAASSIGAVWSVCNQDVAVPGVLARFKQLEPTVMVASDGVRYGGRPHDRGNAISELQDNLPTLTSTVIVPRLGLAATTPGTPQTTWQEAIANAAPLQPVAVPFDHPLWVLFSSGTTGPPKGIVHGHGGILLEQFKFLAFHLDLKPRDVFFWYCSTSWVMWNLVVSALLTGSKIVLYDGSPGIPHMGRLWDISAGHSVTVLGVSPAYLQSCAKDGVRPSATYDLAALRSIGCTGAPVPPSAYRWVSQEVGSEMPLYSLSGGTDVAGGFVAGAPILPIWAGENSGRCLGVAAEAWNDDGRPVAGEVGELVITKPMPSMPLHFWADPDGERYHDAYFDVFPGVWRHGDWITLTDRGSVVVHGRSDATLNRYGVRLGSSEIYQAVEMLPEIQESLVVGTELPDGGYWLALFVHPAEGVNLDEALAKRINTTIREQASPRHVPDDILEVAGLPHTLTGKRLEVPIKRILLGAPVSQVLNLSAVDRPELIEFFANLAATRLVPRITI